MAPWISIFLNGRDLPKIWQRAKTEASIINEKTIAEFTRVVEQQGIILDPVPVKPAQPACNLD